MPKDSPEQTREHFVLTRAKPQSPEPEVDLQRLEVQSFGGESFSRSLKRFPVRPARATGKDCESLLSQRRDLIRNVGFDRGRKLVRQVSDRDGWLSQGDECGVAGL